MKLIIAEKPSLGRSIADAIPGSKSGKDPIYAGDYCITWLYGHILGLKEPQDYDEAYAKWSVEQLPIFFDNWEQKPSEGKEDRLEQIGALLKKAELVIHAGDPDDEGQLLVDEVLRWFHYEGPVKRLDTANTTEAALSRALAHLSENKPREADGWAAYARSVADMMVGVNMSRFFTCLNRSKTLTVGRVQTPTLGLVVNRDLQIEGHEKLVYYTITGELIIDGKRIPYSVQLPKDDIRLSDGRLLNQAEAERIAAALQNRKLENISIASKQETEKPPLPFNLVKLQTYCGNTWGYDPQRVMDITQRLKDSGAITYNRSDCQYLSSDHFKEAPKTTATVCRNLGSRPDTLDTTIKSAAFNDNNITAHFAIIPTDSVRDLSRFSEEERNVYTIIAKYYLAQFMPGCVRKRTHLSAEVPGICTLVSTSAEILDPGFHTLLPVKAEPPTELSTFADGTYSGIAETAAVQEKETKPPARYTKTTLNEDMTRIAKYVEDKKVRSLLLEKDKDKKGENGSIGTSATRATIIDGLILRGFLAEKNKKLISTEMGREFYRILPDELKKPDMTAYWWVIQEQIKSGEVSYSALSESVMTVIHHILSQTYPRLTSAMNIPADRTVVGRCPRCSSYVVEGSRGYGCMGYVNGCKFTIWKQSRSSMLKNLTITPKMAESLLSGDTVETAKLWSAKQEASFFGGLKLEDRGGSYGADLTYVPMTPAPVGVCPRCGGDVIEGRNGFGCANYKNGCKFTIWKKPKGTLLKNITVSSSMAKKLLNGETVTSKRLYSEKKQGEFFGGLKLNDKGGDYGADLELVLNVERPVLGTCPRCGGDVVEGSQGFGCSRYREGCKFVIWKKPKSALLKNITITESAAKRLLKGETITTKRLYSEKKQTEFFGGLKLNDKGADYGADLELVLDVERPVLGSCPRCGGDVIEGNQGYGCRNYKEGCRFTIWKKAKAGPMKNLTLSESIVKKLLAGETIETAKLSVNGTAEAQSGTIRLADKGADYGADFEIAWKAGASVGTCPRCGKAVRVLPLMFRCDGFSDGCRYSIWKHSKLRLFADVEITAEMATQLMRGDCVETDKLYSEKKQKSFQGKFHLEDKGGEYGPSLVLLPFSNLTEAAGGSDADTDTPIQASPLGGADDDDYVWPDDLDAPPEDLYLPPEA